MKFHDGSVRSTFNKLVILGGFIGFGSEVKAQQPTPPPDVDTWEVVSDTTSIPDQNRPSESPKMATPTFDGGNAGNDGGMGYTQPSVIGILQDGIQLGGQILHERQQQKDGAQEVEIKSHEQAISLGTKTVLGVLGMFGKK